MDKSEALKKIKMQPSKRKKEHLSDERRMEMVQGILDANIDNEYLVKSEMPDDIMGVKIDWDENKAVKVVKKDAINFTKSDE